MNDLNVYEMVLLFSVLGTLVVLWVIAPGVRDRERKRELARLRRARRLRMVKRRQR